MIVVVMGVTGCGKTTVGAMLAGACGWEFLDADDYHPPRNVAKMRRGEALTDDDRRPWLDSLGGLLAQSAQQGKSVVLACSALKQAYRERLEARCPGLRLAFLAGEKELIRSRLLSRQGHYMNPALLDSQFAILEAPAGAIVLDVADNPAELVRQLRLVLAV
ncbi:MAG: gluconokinase [Betaproteobacteria bacterium]